MRSGAAMRRASPFAASLILVAAPAHARFAPPLDTPMRVTIVQTRDDGTTVRRFTAERSVTFAENLDGYVAALTLDTVASEGDDISSAMVAGGLSGLLHRTVRCHLDRFGKVTGVDEAEALWQRWLDGMRGMGGADAGRAGAARAATERLAALPPEQRAPILCSALTGLLPQPRDAEIGERQISLPAALPTGAPLTLTGAQLSQHTPDGMIRVVTRAAGAGAGAPSSPPVQMTLETQRTLDPRIGLILEARKTSVTLTGKYRQTMTETVTLTIR